MQRLLSKLTYANVVATLALCLALGGGAAFAAGKIGSNDIAAGGVHTKNLQQRSVTSGKLALGAVRSNQIAPTSVGTDQIAPGAVHSAQLADGAVGTAQLAKGAVGPAQLGKEAVGSGQLAKGAVGAAQLGDAAVGATQLADGAVGPAQMRFPASLAATPSGGFAALSESEYTAYPLAGAGWTPRPGSVDLLTGTVTADIGAAHLPTCQAVIEFGIDENFGPDRVGSMAIAGESLEGPIKTRTVPVFPIIATAPGPIDLTARARESSCNSELTIESIDLSVIELG